MLDFRNKGEHRHMCSNCKHIWQHDEQSVNNQDDHTCKVCGHKVWVKYYLPTDLPAYLYDDWKEYYETEGKHYRGPQ